VGRVPTHYRTQGPKKPHYRGNVPIVT